MPEQKTMRRVARDRREGKSASTQAGEFVREEIEHIRKGDHGARSARQAIAIGLSKARRAGVKLPPPAKGKTSEATRRKAKQDLERGKEGEKPSRKRSRATVKALKKEPKTTVSKSSLSRQAKSAARKRSPADRSDSAKRAARTRKRESAS